MKTHWMNRAEILFPRGSFGPRVDTEAKAGLDLLQGASLLSRALGLLCILLAGWFLLSQAPRVLPTGQVEPSLESPHPAPNARAPAPGVERASAPQERLEPRPRPNASVGN